MAAYLFLFGVAIPGITYFEARFLRPFALLGITATLSLVYFTVRSARRARWSLVPLVFDESDEPLIRTVRLSRE